MSIDRRVAIGVLNVEHATVTTGLDTDAHHLAVGNGIERMALDTLSFEVDTRVEVVGAHLGKASRIERLEIERIAISRRIVLRKGCRSSKQRNEKYS